MFVFFNIYDSANSLYQWNPPFIVLTYVQTRARPTSFLRHH